MQILLHTMELRSSVLCFQKITHSFLLCFLPTLCFWFQGFLPSSAIPPASQTKSVFHFIHIKDRGFPLWMATSWINLGTLTVFSSTLTVNLEVMLSFSVSHPSIVQCCITTTPWAWKNSRFQISHALTVHIPYAWSPSIVHKKSIQISIPPLVN